MGRDAELVEAVVDRLGAFVANNPSRPVRVGIDGRSAAGKTTFADRLAAAAFARGRDVVQASIDDFHPPGHKKRRHSVETYYDSGYEYGRFRSWVLTRSQSGVTGDVGSPIGTRSMTCLP